MDDGSLWNNLELSNSFRNETREYVQHCLDLARNPSFSGTKPVNSTIQAFRTIGTAIRKTYNYGLLNSRCPKLPLDATEFG